jgi:hypothetical protein
MPRRQSSALKFQPLNNLFTVELWGVPNARIIAFTLRVRILHALAGVMEGHSLSQFVPGSIYEVPEALGLQLIEMKAAIEVRSTDAAVLQGDDVDFERLTGGVVIVSSDRAAERPERRRRKRR